MAQPYIQTSFNSGEWSPNLNARVDLSKYRGGAALLRNFFVDYRGGATSRPGTRYIQQTYKTSTTRLIPFQASFTVSYILEFGDSYVRFYNNGAPVLEGGLAITGVTKANPAVVSVVNTYTTGSVDWVYISGVSGMTQLNGQYFKVSARTAGTVTLIYLDGTPVDSTAFDAWTAGGTTARVYTISSPYTAAELAQIKFAQNVNTLVLCHPNYPPFLLTLVSAANWTLAAINFGPTIAAPGTPSSGTTLAAGNCFMAYVITAVDANGQESSASGYATLSNVQDLRTTAATVTVSWAAVTNAVSYNIYKAEIRYSAAVPVGAQFGYVGNCTGTLFIDSNIGPDFSTCVPITVNPFSGTGLATITTLTRGVFGGASVVPSVSFTGGGGGFGAIASTTLTCFEAIIGNPGSGYAVGDTLSILGGFGVTLRVTSVDGFGRITGISVIATGSVPFGSTTPSNNVVQASTSGGGTGADFGLNWWIGPINVTNPGAGYGPAPTVVISPGTATALAVLGAATAGNPTVPSFFQQRLVLAGPLANPQLFNMSQPGAYYNFNVSNPLLPSDAFAGSLVSGKLNSIKSLISQPQGLIALSDQQAWLINGGSAGSGVDATNTVANAQIFNGATDLPPIVAVDDILYVQAKGSIVRDLIFNFNKQVYTGMDISVISSHLFYGFQLLEWAWAEEPFKVVWAVRSDGNLLSLTFLKEQELIAWAHSDTFGAFKSIATITETVQVGAVDAVYTIVQRTINGSTIQYVERMVELYYPTGAINAWCVDAGLAYSGAPTTNFSGARHLAGATVTGLADGILIIPFIMPLSGSFTLPAAASTVVVGLAFTPQLQTLQIDTGEPTIQGKEKKIPAVTVRVVNTLGLKIGTTFDNLVDMDDLIVGNVGKNTNEVVTDLVTGDALQALDPDWNVPGQYCIQQSLPYPCSILGLMPQLTVGDTPK